MATEPFVGAPTISTVEYSFPTASTTRVAQTSTGTFQMSVDQSNFLVTHRIRFRIYEKINGAGATQRIWTEVTNEGVRAGSLVFPALILKDGWDFTAIVLAGADIVIPFSIRKL